MALSDFRGKFKKDIYSMANGDTQTPLAVFPVYLDSGEKYLVLYDKNFKPLRTFNKYNESIGYVFLIEKKNYLYWLHVHRGGEVVLIWANMASTTKNTALSNQTYTKAQVEQGLTSLLQTDEKNRELLQTAGFLLVQAQATGKEVSNEMLTLDRIAKQYQERQNKVKEYSENKSITGIETIDNYIFQGAAYIGKKLSAVKSWLGFNGLGFLPALSRVAPRLATVLSKSWKTVKIVGTVVLVGDIALTLGKWLFGSEGKLEEAKTNQEELNKVIPQIMAKLNEGDKKELETFINQKIEEAYNKGKNEGKSTQISHAAKNVAYALGAMALVIALLKFSK